MLGSEIVARLKLRGHDAIILHRGNWYWDSSIRIKPWVNYIQCDRDNLNECADKLGDLTREKGVFDAVIDFSGYRPSQIKVNKQDLTNSRPLLFPVVQFHFVLILVPCETARKGSLTGLM